MYRILLAVMVLVCTASCGPRYVDFFPYDDNGRPKPAVAILPIADRANTCWAWNASETLNRTIYHQLMHQGELYVLSSEEMGDLNAPVEFTTSEEELSQRFTNADFVVIMELVEDGYASIKSNSTNVVAVCMPYETMLKMKVRVKVIDARPRAPRVVLQEIIAVDFLLPQPNLQMNAELNRNPSWLAHQHMSSTLVRRVERVIQSAY